MRAAALVLLGALAQTAPCAAADARWEPGHRTTSTVRGEVTTRDYAGEADGVYGRFGGDLDLGLGLGAELVEGHYRGVVRGSLHYFWMAGTYLQYARGEAGEDYDQSQLALGIDLRPAFIPRWSQHMSQGPAWLDLALDSISLGLGAYWAERAPGRFGDRRGFEASLGLGLALMGRAEGLWLSPRGTLRWPDLSGAAEPSVLVLLSWHTLLLSPWARSD